MIQADRHEAQKEATLRNKGFNIIGSMENPPTNLVDIQAFKNDH